MKKMNMFIIMGLMITNLSFMQDQDKNKFDGLLYNFKVTDDGKIIGIQGSPNFSEECKELINNIDSCLQPLFILKEKMDKHRRFKLYENEVDQLSKSIRDLKENNPSDLSLPQQEKLLKTLDENKPPRSFKLGSSFELEINEKLNNFDKTVEFNESLKKVLKDSEKNERERADIQLSDNMTSSARVKHNKFALQRRIKLLSDKIRQIDIFKEEKKELRLILDRKKAELISMILDDDRGIGWMEYLFGYAFYNNFTSYLSVQQELKVSEIDHDHVKQAIKRAAIIKVPLHGISEVYYRDKEDLFEVEDSDKYKNLFDRLAK